MKMIIFILIFICNFILIQINASIVMINPAGHAKDSGRRLMEGVERAQTFNFAEKLQQELQNEYSLKVILTRYPGEEIIAWESASFANRLGIDFYLSLHLYREEELKPKIFLYQLVYDPMSDFCSRNFDPYVFIPVWQAHFKNIHQTRFYGKYIKDKLTIESYSKNFDFYGLYGLPLKPLCGIVAPALLLEIGIHRDEQWQSLIGPLVESFSFLV
ncbi:hypothetical protein GF322_04915 [Candidatus Dependentiae bacterium]|nr:hypothetical protein [Candidatus Dependentiae bacterium]